MAYGAPLGATQLARDTGLTPQGVRPVLDALADQGLVSVLGQPRSQLFSVAPEHPFAGALKALFEQERARWGELQQTLRDALRAHKEVRSAWLYGSVARGEDAPHSDIDIALVVDNGEPDFAVKVREALQALEDRFLVHFSVVALTPAEVVRLAPDDNWWAAVARDAKVLKGVGPEHEAVRCARAVSRHDGKESAKVG